MSASNPKVMTNFRPMLAASLPTGNDDDLRRLDYSHGFLCSPKMDGIRAISHPELGLISRTLKPIRNKHIQKTIVDLGPSCYYLDGELVLDEADDVREFNDNQSAIMSGEGTPRFTYNVFDHLEHMNASFENRLQYLTDVVWRIDPALCIRLTPQRFCKSMDEILEYEQEQLAKGYEGIIIRHPNQRYKNNRSTFREMGMIKLKRFEDAEAEIIGFEELYRNANEAYKDNLGYQKRTAHQANQVPTGILGKFVCKGINGKWKDVVFRCGSGLDMSTRDRIWSNRPRYLGRLIKYKYQDHGSKDAPRTPIFLGFRDPEDM